MRLAFTGTPIRVYCRFSEVYYTPEGMDTRGIQGTPTLVQSSWTRWWPRAPNLFLNPVCRPIEPLEGLSAAVELL